MQDIYCEKNFWYVRHNPLLIFLYYPVHNALLDVWKKRETANHVEKSLHDSLGTKIYAVQCGFEENYYLIETLWK